MSTEQNKTIIRKWVEEGWNKGNLALVDEIFAPNFVHHDPSNLVPVNNSEAMKKYVGMVRTAFPDATFTIEDLLAEGDEVLWRYNFHGTDTGPFGAIPPTGKTGDMTGMGLFRFVGGKVAEVWVNADQLGLLQQLGLVPKMG